MHCSLSFETQYDVYMDDFYPQFRRNPKARPFGKEWYDRAWISEVNSVWREIIDSRQSALAMFNGAAPYDQFYAAFELFEQWYQQGGLLGEYPIASAARELSDLHEMQVSPGYCLLGAKFAGFKLRFDTPGDAPMIDSRQVFAEIKRDTEHARYEQCYALCP